MFILRRITRDNQESNEFLGEYYNIVDSEKSKSDFEAVLKRSDFAGDIYCFIICRDGMQTIPLYKNSNYYIMLSNGKTFDNLTFKS